MAGTQLTAVGAAQAVRAATWRARVLDTGAVHDELARLWRELGDTRVPPQPDADGAVPAADGALMRANTLNLIAVARSASDAARIEDAIVHLTEFHPSRTIILVADPARRAAGAEPGLDVRVALLEQAAVKGRPAVRFECITVVTDSDAITHIASVASPLLVSELPDFLWWPGGSVPTGSLFEEMDESIDRLIVDTAALADPAPGLRTLAELTGRIRGCPKLSDFAWARLTPWRQMIAQFFDVPAAQPCLDCIEEVDILFAAPNPHRDGASGLTAALLMAGWLSTRLGWRAPGELIPVGDGWRLTLSAGSGRTRREVRLTLRSTDDLAAERCLGGITLAARGTAPGTFTVERVDLLGVTTASATPTAPKVSRMVYAEPPNDNVLLNEELHTFARDRVFEEALTFAAGLLPGED